MESEYSIKLRLEKLSRSKLFVSSCILCFLFILSTIISLLAAPQLMKDLSVNIYKCDKINHRDCYTTSEINEIWEAIIPNVNRLGQFLYMSVTPHSIKSIEFNLTMDIEVLHDSQVLQRRSLIKQIVCSRNSCNSVKIFYMPYLEYDSYSVIIKHKSPILSDNIEIDLRHVNENFTKYQIIIKYTFFVLAMIGYLQFIALSSRIPKNLRSFECKSLYPLGLSLILFNEPQLIVTIYLMSPLWSAISVFSNTQFLAVLLLFWFFQLHHYRDSKFNLYFIIVESIVVAVLFILSFCIYLYMHEEHRNNPTFDWQYDLNTTYKNIFITIIAICVLLFLWIFVLAILSIAQIKRLSMRERVVKVLSLAMILFTFAAVFIGGFQPLPRTGNLFLIILSAFNFYVLALLYLYSPTKTSILEYRTEKNIEYSLIKSHEEDSIELT